MTNRLSPVGTGRSLEKDIEPNLLALTVFKQLEPVVGALADASPHLEPQRSCGIESIRTRAGTRWRPSTDAECYRLQVDLIDFRLMADARQPIPPQVARWLREVSAELLATADAIDGIDDDRERIPTPKPSGPRKAALVASLAGAVALTGCCKCPPAAAPVSVAGIPVTVQDEPRRQGQSTITIHDGGNSVQIQTTSGGNVTSRVTVGPDGKMEVQEVEVSPSK